MPSQVTQVGRRFDVRVLTWNLAFSSPSRAALQGNYLRTLEPDLVCLQELNPASAESVRQHAELKWLSYQLDPSEASGSGRRRLAAVGGRIELVGAMPQIRALPLPERVHVARVATHGIEMLAISYHAPPGVSWGYRKVEQALGFLDWLNDASEPLVLGADANTPEIDHPDFLLTRTHWHTGMRRLGGLPGDDLVWGPARRHRLSDSYRLWLQEHADALAEIRRLRPAGPLAESHWTGKRRNASGTGRRFDSIWVSPELSVIAVSYLSDALALSDHAAVLADLCVVEKIVREPG